MRRKKEMNRKEKDEYLKTLIPDTVKLKDLKFLQPGDINSYFDKVMVNLKNQILSMKELNNVEIDKSYKLLEKYPIPKAVKSEDKYFSPFLICKVFPKDKKDVKGLIFKKTDCYLQAHEILLFDMEEKELYLYEYKYNFGDKKKW